MDAHAPLRKVSQRELKLQHKPWITKGILCSIRKRDIIFRQFKKCVNPVRKSNLLNKYKTYRNQIASLTRASKKIHMSDFFTLNKNNTRKIWQGIKSIINVKDSSMSSPTCIVSEGKTITDPMEIAESFNAFFSNVGKNIQNNVYSNHTHFSRYLNHPANDNFFCSPTHPKEI